MASTSAAAAAAALSATHVRLMCSFGGRILPRPHDRQLRYVGGETRIVSVPRDVSFSSLLSLLARLSPTLFNSPTAPPALKYQLPHEDLDALISLTSDDDVEIMMEEIDRLSSSSTISSSARSPRLRLFLFSRITSGAAFAGESDRWFLDALNGSGSGSGSIDRVRSEASSVVSSEVPDYLFGLDAVSDDRTSHLAHDSTERMDVSRFNLPVEPIGPGYVADHPNQVYYVAPHPQVPVYYVPGPVQYLLPYGEGHVPVGLGEPVYEPPAGGGSAYVYPTGGGEFVWAGEGVTGSDRFGNDGK